MRDTHRPRHIQKDNATYFITGRTYGGLPHLAKEGAKELFKKMLFEKANKFNFDLKGWTILNNHYHLLLEVARARFVSRFINELHGAASFGIKKLPPVEILNGGQVAYRKRTPMEDRIERRLDSVVASFSSRSPKGIASFSSRSPKGIASFSSRNVRGLKSANTSARGGFEIATFTSRLTKEQMHQIEKALDQNDHHLAKILLLSYLPEKFDIPFWYQYLDHVIRSDEDYFKHLNYIHQNPVKHGYTKDMAKYQFSSYNRYLREKGKEWLADCFARYPIVDFMPKGIAD